MNEKKRKTLEEIEKTLKENEAFLREKFKVKEIGIFGSYVRGEQKEKSDVDMFVEFYESVSLLHLVGLENFLTDLIGIKADIGTKKSIKPRIKEQVLKEAIIIPICEKEAK
jgi:predicted nucleotidyltransferase